MSGGVGGAQSRDCPLSRYAEPDFSVDQKPASSAVCDPMSVSSGCNRIRADWSAANLLPLIRELQPGGVTRYQAIARELVRSPGGGGRACRCAAA